MSSFLFPRTLAVFGFPWRNNYADKSCQRTMTVPLSDTWVSREHWRWSAASTGGMMLSPLLVAMSRDVILVLKTRSAIRDLRDSYSHYRYPRDPGFGLNRISSRSFHPRGVLMQSTA